MTLSRVHTSYPFRSLIWRVQLSDTLPVVPVAGLQDWNEVIWGHGDES